MKKNEERNLKNSIANKEMKYYRFNQSGVHDMQRVPFLTQTIERGGKIWQKYP